MTTIRPISVQPSARLSAWLAMPKPATVVITAGEVSSAATLPQQIVGDAAYLTLLAAQVMGTQRPADRARARQAYREATSDDAIFSLAA
jgi:hypothetical protein